MKRLAWRAALPPRWGWVRLLAAPSSYLLAFGLIVVVVAKAGALRGLAVADAWPVAWPWAVTRDVLVHAALIALFALGEGRARWLYAITVPLSLLVAGLAAINAAYLSIAGEQLSWEAVAYGQEAWDELRGILGEGLADRAVSLAVIGAPAIATPFVARWLVRRHAGVAADTRIDAAADERADEAGTREASAIERRVLDGRQRAHCAAAVGAVALLAWAILPAPDAFAARRLGRNATLQTYRGWVAGDEPAPAGAEPVEFVGYQPALLVEPDALAELARRPAASDATAGAAARQNVVLVILESTRYDFTSLAGAGSPAQTPNLLALAEAGMSVTRTRAVLPHTTKSVFSLLCGRLPLMQRAPIEVSTYLQVQCLPAILGAAGYDTAFFQSALGTFEHRPRLVAQLGYARFQAWEDIGGQPLGYLASDDESLGPAFERWLEGAREPVFATLLTSATHHPYRLSDEAARRAAADGLPASTDGERFARLVEAEDRLIGAVLAALAARGLRERTIVVAVGDHGEGFGGKGVRQHDNNFFEEGLRVPFVLAGPGVPRGEIARNASLADVAPSLLDVLDVRIADESRAAIHGRSVFADDAAGTPAAPRWFGCYYASRCRGFVLGDRKLVALPQRQQAFWFDLARDPDEQTAMPLTDDLRALLPALHQVMDAHTARRFPLELGELGPDGTRPGYGDWRCPAGQPCRHPASPPGAFFEPP